MSAAKIEGTTRQVIQGSDDDSSIAHSTFLRGG
jgi:hypothetical protein